MTNDLSLPPTTNTESDQSSGTAYRRRVVLLALHVFPCLSVLVCGRRADLVPVSLGWDLISCDPLPC